MEDAMDLKSDDMDAETRELFEGYKAAARELRKQGAKLTNKELSGTYARTLHADPVDYYVYSLGRILI